MTPSMNIEVNSSITPAELYDFYFRNDICKIGIIMDVADRVLGQSHLYP